MGEVATGNRYPYVPPDRTKLLYFSAFPKVATLQKELDELTFASAKVPLTPIYFKELIGQSSSGIPSWFARFGNVNGSSLNNLGSNGNYWSSTVNNANNAYNLNFNGSNIWPSNNNNRNNGFSVRCMVGT